MWRFLLYPARSKETFQLSLEVRGIPGRRRLPQSNHTQASSSSANTYLSSCLPPRIKGHSRAHQQANPNTLTFHVFVCPSPVSKSISNFFGCKAWGSLIYHGFRQGQFMAGVFEPAEYQPVDIKQFPPSSLRETAEGKYWRRFKAPVVAKQVSAG